MPPLGEPLPADPLPADPPPADPLPAEPPPADPLLGALPPALAGAVAELVVVTGDGGGAGALPPTEAPGELVSGELVSAAVPPDGLGGGGVAATAPPATLPAVLGTEVEGFEATAGDPDDTEADELELVDDVVLVVDFELVCSELAAGGISVGALVGTWSAVTVVPPQADNPAMTSGAISRAASGRPRRVIRRRAPCAGRRWGSR